MIRIVVCVYDSSVVDAIDQEESVWRVRITTRADGCKELR